MFNFEEINEFNRKMLLIYTSHSFRKLNLIKMLNIQFDKY